MRHVLKLPRLMSDIPNQAGFRLHGVTILGSLLPLTVQRNPETGCHYLVDDYGGRWPCWHFSTWVPDTAEARAIFPAPKN